jgi:parvulin-like peptidyl-prolyl isomerase
MRKLLSLVLPLVPLAIGLFWLMPLGALAEEKGTAQTEAIPSVVARVNGKEISADQYRNQWHILHRMLMRAGRRQMIGPEYAESMKHEVVERLIVLELLRQKADQTNIRVDPEEVEEKLQEIQRRGGWAGAMARGLGGQEPNWDAYRADITNSMKIKKLLKQEVYDKVTVEPKEVSDHYNANLEDFKVPDQVRARHILIRIPIDATDVQRKEALEAIQKAAQRIQKGEAFEQVAKEVSHDGSAPQGGDLGYFGRGRMVPEFEKVAFSLEKGQVSDIVQTQFGYHLIKVEDQRPARTKLFQEVASEIEELLRRMKAESLGRDYTEKLRAEAQIERIPF